MYEITVRCEFCAAHAIMIEGTREPVHGHNWRVAATIAGDALDADGLLCDFHTVQDTLVNICAVWDNQDLNTCAPFDTLNPSAEHVARVIAEELSMRLDGALAEGAVVSRVSVTEAPGCEATYTP